MPNSTTVRIAAQRQSTENRKGQQRQRRPLTAQYDGTKMGVAVQHAKAMRVDRL
jgi:hypothetical protein